MKTLPIRYWLLLAWIGMLLSANLLVGLLQSLQGDSKDQRQQSLKTIQATVTRDATRWTDLAWQRGLQSVLTTHGGVVVIRDASGQERYRSDASPTTDQPDQVVVLTDGQRQIGTAEIFAPQRLDSPWIGLTTALFSYLFLVLGAGWFIGRMVLRPLTAMSQAARQIAGGDLDVHVPASRVREVAEVAVAFQAMGEGLRAALERQANLEQERRLFISAIAHDLRTPLFALRGYLEGWAKGLATTPEKAAHYLAVCQEQAAILDRRIASLFAYARLEYLEQAPRRELLDWCLLVQQTVERLRPHADSKGVTLQTAPLDASCMLAGDAQLLTRVLENLLDNAIRYTPRGGNIQVRWQKQMERFCFTVADSGPGIALDDLPHLFAPLYRSESSRNRQTGGAGLGLTIARRILLAHGGDLYVSNGAAGGAEVTGWLLDQHSMKGFAASRDPSPTVASLG
jgi:signal transduction histidine kinase